MMIEGNIDLIKKKHKSTKIMSLLLILTLLLTSIYGCGSFGNVTSNEKASIQSDQTNLGVTSSITSDIPLDVDNDDNVQENLSTFAYSLLRSQYLLIYETFNASVILEDGSEIYGLGFTDFETYYERDDNSGGYFPAGFIPNNPSDFIPEDELSNGLIIYNLDYEDSDYGFVLAYNSSTYLHHFIKSSQYVRYGISDAGTFFVEATPYERGTCDESLGALYSYDENRYVFNPDVKEFVNLTGESLATSIDYQSLIDEVNRILAEQDALFTRTDVETAAYFSQEAISDYLLALQEETFLGCNVKELVACVEQLDPLQCVRFTPQGQIVVNIDGQVPGEATALSKWLVGSACVITVASTLAANAFVPALRPATAAISSAAIDVFIQVVIENHAVEDIQWSKVAVAAVSGALMAWACPLGASKVTTAVANAGKTKTLAKLAGYGVLTISNGLTSGVTNAAISLIDGKEGVLNAFLVGAAVGAAGTIVASALGESFKAASKLAKAKMPNSFSKSSSGSISKFIGKHQVHLKNSAIEEILNPKSVYAAAEEAYAEINSQLVAKGIEKKGGSYKDVKATSSGAVSEVHETPSFSSTGAEKRCDGPSIKMDVDDHKLTGSYGNSNDAKQYRLQQSQYIEKGDYKSAIQMDIDDIRSKFGNKYDDGIAEMLKYAESIGWWK